MTMNKELIKLLNDLKDLAANEVAINLESLKHTITSYHYSMVVSVGVTGGKLGIFDNFSDLCPFNPICLIHYIHINENDILVTSVTNSRIKEMDFVLY